MRTDWRTVPLSEVAALSIERVPVESGKEYRMAGVLNEGRGMFARDAITAEGTSYRYFHVVRAGQLVMRKLTAFEGAIGVVSDDIDGSFVSAEFPTFALDVRHIRPDFMALVCQRPAFWHEMLLRSTGTVLRRKRVNPGALLSIPIELPPLDEQRRIADLIQHIDAYVGRLAHVGEDANRVLVGVRRQAYEQGPLVALGSFLERIEAGKSPVAEERPSLPGERSLLKVSAVNETGFDPSETKAVHSATVLPEASRLRNGDLLMTRANTAQRVGLVCIAEGVPADYFLCDKTLRLVPSYAPDRQLLHELLLAPQVRTQLTLAATGTSGSMKNVSQDKIRALLVPSLAEDAVQALIGTCRAIREVVTSTTRATQAAVLLRGALLATLLSGGHGLGDGYDDLLSGV